jgi:hypothetical protein
MTSGASLIHSLNSALDRGAKPSRSGFKVVFVLTVYPVQRVQSTDDSSYLIDQQAQLVADDPAMAGEALATDLLGAALFRR